MKGWAASGVRTDAGNAGWKESAMELEEGGFGVGPGGKGTTESRWGFDTCVKSIKEEGTGGVVDVEGKMD